MHARGGGMRQAWLAVTLAIGGLASAPTPGATPDGDAPMARLQIVDGGHGPEAWAENLLVGPIEVMLRAIGPAPSASPSLPARATVPARGRVLVSRLARADAALVLDVVPGHPAARPADVEYGWPLDTHALRIGQGWGGGFSHDDAENRHAVDFEVPEGTPVLAARDGVVMQAESRFASGGLHANDDTGRANFVRILHGDGTMALYAHLAHQGVHVRPGEHVRRGQRIPPPPPPAGPATRATRRPAPALRRPGQPRPAPPRSPSACSAPGDLRSATLAWGGVTHCHGSTGWTRIYAISRDEVGLPDLHGAGAAGQGWGKRCGKNAQHRRARARPAPRSSTAPALSA